MWNMVKTRPDLSCYWQKNDRPGVHKGKETADDYQYMFNSKLKNQAILFDWEFFTTSSRYNTTTIKILLQEQLERYHFAYEEPNTIHQNPRQTITGKIGTSEQDDLAIATLQAVYWARAVLRDPRRVMND